MCREQELYGLLLDKNKVCNMIPAGPTKCLYISIGLEAAIHHQAPSLPPSHLNSILPPPLPPTVCLPSPLACYQARYGADGVPPFSDWPSREGWAWPSRSPI